MEKYFFKLVHDMTFQIIVNIICLNIIFGIVVNSFAELRDQKSKMILICTIGALFAIMKCLLLKEEDSRVVS